MECKYCNGITDKKDLKKGTPIIGKIEVLINGKKLKMKKDGNIAKIIKGKMLEIVKVEQKDKTKFSLLWCSYCGSLFFGNNNIWKPSNMAFKEGLLNEQR